MGNNTIRWFIMLIVAVLGLAAGVAWNRQPASTANDDSTKQELWERVARLSVYDAPRRARYPALTRTQRRTGIV